MPLSPVGGKARSAAVRRPPPPFALAGADETPGKQPLGQVRRPSGPRGSGGAGSLASPTAAGSLLRGHTPAPSVQSPLSRTTPNMQLALCSTALERLREDPGPPSRSLPPRPATAGVAVVKRISGGPLRPLKAITGTDSPRPACDPRGSPPPPAREPPYKATESGALRFPAKVVNGFDKLTHALGEVMGKLPDDDSLDHRWIRVGKWMDRYFVDQTPSIIAERLLPVLDAAANEAAGLARPNLPLVSASCALLRQALILLSTMWPSFSRLASETFRNVIGAVYVRDPLDMERAPPKLLLDSDDDDELRRQLLSYGGKTYFQALREMNKKFGQTMTGFEQREKERSKLIEAMDRIGAVWQLMFTGQCFKAWRAVRRERLETQEWEQKVRALQAENKDLVRKQARVDELVEEVRCEKNKEIHLLRKQTLAAEEVAEELRAQNAALLLEIKQRDESIAELTAEIEQAAERAKVGKRSADLRYSKLAKTAFELVQRMGWPRWEFSRLLEWEHYFLPFENGGQNWSSLNATGDSEGLIDWANAMAARHPCHAEFGVQPMEWFNGSTNACHVWACVCGTLAPGVVDRDDVARVMSAVRPDFKGQRVCDMLRDMHIADVVSPDDLVRESGDACDNHHLLAVVLLQRFLQPDTTQVVQDAPDFSCPEEEYPSSPGPQRSWPRAEAGDPAYDTENPMPEEVARYNNMSSGALMGAHELIEFSTRRWTGFARTALWDGLGGFAAGQRYRSRHGKGLTRREIIDRPKFLDLRLPQLKGAVETEAQIEAIKRVLRRNYRHLRKIFRYYGASDSRNMDPDLSADELWRLCAECSIPSKGVFDRTDFRIIFSRCNFVEAGGPKQQLDATEFVHALVHIAHHRLKHKVADPAEQLQVLLESFVLPEASYVDAAPFRNALRDPLCKAVLDRRANDFAKVFKHYASIEMTDSSATVSFKEFMRMMMDCKVVDEVCTHHALQNVFLKMQSEDGSQGQMEMEYQEFVDAICAIAVFKNPAPYMPTHSRIQRFWQNWVLPPLKKQLKLTDGVEKEDKAGEASSAAAGPAGAS